MLLAVFLAISAKKPLWYVSAATSLLVSSHPAGAVGGLPITDDEEILRDCSAESQHEEDDNISHNYQDLHTLYIKWDKKYY